MIHKLIAYLLLIISISVAIPAAASAANVFNACSGTGTAAVRAQSTNVCQQVGNQPIAHPSPIIGTLKIVISVISWIIGVTSIIVIIIGGLRMVIGGGDPQSVASARNSIIYALVGIVVAVLAQTIVVFVLDKV